MNNEKGLIIVISGPAGSGKSTITKVLKEDPDFVFSISRTTRYTRKGEQDGVDYYFISKEEFNQKLAEDDFLEYAEYCDELYGTPKSLVYEQVEKGKNVILEIEVAGAMQVKEKCPDAVLIMLLPPNFKTQEERLRKRGTEVEEKIQSRLAKTRRELPYAPRYDYIVTNYDGKEADAVNDIYTIIRAEKLATSRKQDIVQLYYED